MGQGLQEVAEVLVGEILRGLPSPWFTGGLQVYLHRAKTTGDLTLFQGGTPVQFTACVATPPWYGLVTTGHGGLTQQRLHEELFSKIIILVKRAV